MGESTGVEWSPLKATVPVASRVGRNAVFCTVTRWMRARCSCVSVNAPERPLVESAGRAEPLLEQAAAASSSTIARKGEMTICLTVTERGEGNTEGALEIGAGDVGRRERVGELVFGVEQRSPRVEHLQRRRAAQRIADRGDAERLPRRRHELVAEKEH